MVTISFHTKSNFNGDEIINKFKGNNFGTFIAKEVKRIVDPFTPIGTTGNLRDEAVIQPFKIIYGMPGTQSNAYASYMYNGNVYIDPIYKVGGFYSPQYGWWSRPGVKKIPSGRPFHYTNPMATDHWDEKAENAGQFDKLVQIIDNALNSNRF